MSRYFVKLDQHPAVAEWYARITARDSFAKSLPTEGGIYEQEFYPPWPIEKV